MMSNTGFSEWDIVSEYPLGRADARISVLLTSVFLHRESSPGALGETVELPLDGLGRARDHGEVSFESSKGPPGKDSRPNGPLNGFSGDSKNPSMRVFLTSKARQHGIALLLPPQSSRSGI